MSRCYGLALGSLAMAIVMIRGAILGENADDVAIESIVALVVFILIGLVAGWIADHLIRDAVETGFRKRVDWYRQGLADAGYNETKTNEAT